MFLFVGVGVGIGVGVLGLPRVLTCIGVCVLGLPRVPMCVASVVCCGFLVRRATDINARSSVLYCTLGLVTSPFASPLSVLSLGPSLSFR